MYTRVKESDPWWLEPTYLRAFRPTETVFMARNTSYGSVNTPFSDLLQLGVTRGLGSEDVHRNAGVVLKVTLQGVSPKRRGVSRCQRYDERGLGGTSEW